MNKNNAAGRVVFVAVIATSIVKLTHTIVLERRKRQAELHAIFAARDAMYKKIDAGEYDHASLDDIRTDFQFEQIVAFNS